MTTIWTKELKAAIIGFLLNEDGSFLLQETGCKIVLNRAWSIENPKHDGNFVKSAKIINTAWTKGAKA
jgi:hypothetical protein